MADTDESGSDICRVCRMEGTSDRPLYHPCICTGSIKYIHQECLTQWLKYSKKEYCELCNYKYTFMPNMPKRLPVNDLVFGLFKNLGRALSYWLHYTAVAIAWLGIVPLTACRIYRCLFTGSLNSILSLPLDMLSTENLMFDCLQGFFILAVTLCTFISLIWLREQIVQGDMAQWVNNNDPPAAQPADAGGGGGGAGAQNPGQAVADEGGDSEGEEDGLLVNNAGDLANNANVNAGVAAQEHHNAEAVGPEDENVIAPAAVAEPAPLENDDANWQPFEWNQAADELTWERLLGLDGSLVFLEHVFWVISLNTLFILVFGFSPYHIGHFVVIACNLLPHVSATYFEGVVTILIGYFVIAAALFVTHKLLRLFSMSKTSKFLGMCYLVIKVFLLVVMEIGIFPVLCGFWLDVCSLSLFNSTMKDRVDSYHGSPGTSLFIHWLVGMVYVFYFASFVLLLREVLRPGVLWFLRNLNDPDFNPIKEMIQFPVYRHLRRFGASLAMFGVTIILIVFVPIQLIFKFCPKVLPYNISLSVEAPLSELSLELLLLQVVLPALLEQGHARQALKTVARRWCFVVGRALDLLEYLLPAEDLQRRDRNHNVILNVNDVANNGQAQQQAAQAQAGNNLAIVAHAPNNAAVHLADRLNNLAAEHQAILGMAAGPGGEQAYRRSSWFPLRICALLIVLSLSFLMASLLCLTVPVSIGREVIALFLGRTPIHELYTMACGLYLSWVVLRVWVAAVEWLPEGWDAVCTTLRNWACVAAKFASVGVALAGVLPLALGLLFQLVVITPMRVSTNQSPIFFLWQDWAMGILHCKIVCAIVMMGPDWWLKQVFERIYLDGLRNMNVGYIYSQLIVPVMLIVGLVITVPYAVARTIVPALGTDMETQVQFQRHVYPCLLVLTMIVAFLWWQTVQFMRLIQHIRNDKYLVGQRLVNYERSREVALNSEASRTTTAQEDEASNLAEMPEVEGAEEIHNVQQIMAEA